ncbi:hypothetical protein [Ralstonia insidiosa]|jgi:hypothetical protein|nr:hypothetical protein [Ralstonia insidiosa]MBX3904624.1 hypothetical protein [Ralstonia insidiosa]
MKKVVALTLCLGGLLAAGQAFGAEQAVTVQSYRFSASVACSDGSKAERESFPVSVRVPLSNAEIFFFSPPWPRTDLYSITWSIRSACDTDPDAVVHFEVRNIDEAGFVLSGDAQGIDGDGPSFMTKFAGDDAEVPLQGKGAILRVHRTAGEKQVYPNANAAIHDVLCSVPGRNVDVCGSTGGRYE